MPVHFGENRFGQSVSFRKVPEVEDGGLVRNAFIAQFDTRKPALGLTVIQCLFGHRVAQGISILEEVNAQPRLQRHRRDLLQSMLEDYYITPKPAGFSDFPTHLFKLMPHHCAIAFNRL